MLVLRYGYALVFGPSDVRKPYQGMDHPMGYVAEKGMPMKLGRHVTACKRVTELLEEMCSKEGKVEE